MKRKFAWAFDQLERMGVPVYVHVDDKGNFSINAEDPKADGWVSYHNAPVHWDFGVCPEINQILRKQDLFAEWVNPGRLSIYEA